MIKLQKYDDAFEPTIIDYIIAFFGFHIALNGKTGRPDDRQAKENLAAWTGKDHELYIIQEDDMPIGFLHIGYRGGNVAWIEDVFVAEDYRGKGVGTQAITEAEKIIRGKPGYTAVCMDVAPRNSSALHLYRELGYDTLSIVTVRKEFEENPSDDMVDFLGHRFII